MRGKIYTLPELNRALPLIRAIVEDVVDGYRRLKRELEILGYGSRHAPLQEPIEERDLPWDVRDLLDEIRDWIDELGALAVWIRDPEVGLVEAYGEKAGEIVYFSWKPGEERVRYWHALFRSPRERWPVPAMA